MSKCFPGRDAGEPTEREYRRKPYPCSQKYNPKAKNQQ